MPKISNLTKERKVALLMLLLSIFLFLVLFFLSNKMESKSPSQALVETKPERLQNAITDIPSPNERNIEDSKVDNYETLPTIEDEIFDIEKYWDHLQESLPPNKSEAIDSNALLSSLKMETLNDTLSIEEYLFQDSGNTISQDESAQNPVKGTSPELTREQRHQNAQTKAHNSTQSSYKDIQEDRDYSPKENSEKEFFYQKESSSSRSFQCMFSHKMKIKEGDEVSFVLMEDLDEDGIFLPCGSTLLARCSFDNSRLILSVSSIGTKNMTQKIEYQAYDINGMLGLNCIMRNLGNDSLSESIKSKATQRISILPTDIISLSSLLGNKKTHITIEAGYSFYIKKTLSH